MAEKITIEKAYFETLLRRAEFHASSSNYNAPSDGLTVTIPKVEHDTLLRGIREYNTLREALFRGGISPETLELLINGNSNIQGRQEDQPTFSPGDIESEAGGVYFSRPTASVPVSITAPPEGHDVYYGESYSPRNHMGVLKPRNGNHIIHRVVNDNEFTPPDNVDKEDGWNLRGQNKVDKQHQRNEQRTLLLTNLSDRTTHKDIVDVIRGGMLLDVYIRSAERSASVSFVDGSAAQEFLNYTKRNDIYINGKRVLVRWNDRQFILPGHVASKINIGATRNLVLRNVNANITAERIREDLDHIFNLVVIDIFFQNGSAHVSLNSIHNALFARTCMMSRGAYKGIKIEWYADECAQSLPKQQPAPRRENLSPPVKKATTVTNRFNLLNIDGTEDGDDDSETDVTATSAISPYDNNINWAENTVSA